MLHRLFDLFVSLVLRLLRYLSCLCVERSCCSCPCGSSFVLLIVISWVAFAFCAQSFALYASSHLSFAYLCRTLYVSLVLRSLSFASCLGVVPSLCVSFVSLLPVFCLVGLLSILVLDPCFVCAVSLLFCIFMSIYMSLVLRSLSYAPCHGVERSSCVLVFACHSPRSAFVVVCTVSSLFRTFSVVLGVARPALWYAPSHPSFRTFVLVFVSLVLHLLSYLSSHLSFEHLCPSLYRSCCLYCRVCLLSLCRAIVLPMSLLLVFYLDCYFLACFRFLCSILALHAPSRIAFACFCWSLCRSCWFIVLCLLSWRRAIVACAIHILVARLLSC